MGELGVPVTQNQQSELAAMLLAALAKRAMQLRTAANHFYRLAVAHDYEHPYKEVITLYGLDDEWIGGWGRTEQQLEGATTEALHSILSQSEPTFGVLDNQAVQRLARLLPGAPSR